MKKSYFIIIFFTFIFCNKKKEDYIMNEKVKLVFMNRDTAFYLDDTCFVTNEADVIELKTNTNDEFLLIYTGLHAGSSGYMFYIMKKCEENKFCKVSETQGFLDSINIENKKSIIYYHRNSNSIERNYIMYFNENNWKTDKQIGVNNIPIEILHKVFKNKTIKEIEDLVYNVKDSVIYFKKEQIHYLKNPIFIDSVIGVYKGNILKGYNKLD